MVLSFKNLRKFFFLALLTLFSNFAFCQVTVNTLRGKVVDNQSKYPLIGVSVILSEKNLGTTTDTSGFFSIPNIPVGRINLKISLIGYKTQTIPNLVIQSGKETFIDIELVEEIQLLNEVVIKSEDIDSRKRELNNEMTTVSSRTFYVDDTKRFAGSRNDPARMAANFAGVVGNNDARNDIVIRGNSPLGLLWMLEGIPIPNPNHYGSFGATGGPVSMLNNNVLSKSDFLTGAFPAMYNNSTSGVFDLKLRNGNNKKREYIGQVGLNGFEFGAEGYFKKGKTASYLINYRYSALALLSVFGLKVDAGFGRAVPFYQDFNMKINIPLNKKTVLSHFALIGASKISLRGKDEDSTNFFSGFDRNVDYLTNTYVIGNNITRFINSKTSFKIGLAFTQMKAQSIIDSLNINNKMYEPSYRRKATDNKWILTFNYNKKISAKNVINWGINSFIMDYSYIDSVRFMSINYFQIAHNISNKNTSLIQSYFQWQHKPNDNVTVNSGLTSQYFGLNKIISVEPRLGIKYDLKHQNSINLGVGLHSQLQNLEVYYLQTYLNREKYILTNTNLGFTKSFQTILSYQHLIKNKWNFKSEVYYQHLYNVPVESKPSYYSVLNEGTGYRPVEADSLVNKGKGRNYGLELTLEKYFSEGFYLLNTISLYESKYKGSNGIEKNTAYNGKYIINLLAGKEWNVRKQDVVSIDVKYTLAGGKRYTPVNQQESVLKKQPVYISDQTNDLAYKAYSRFDFKITYKINLKKVSHEVYFDVQNVFATKNIFNQEFDKYKYTLVTQYQLGLNPILNYRVQF